MFRRILSFLKYIFFGKDRKSDIYFLIFIFSVYFIIQLTFPYLISVVMTTSMEHTYFSCEKYVKYNITCDEIKKWPFSHGINRGDVVIILPVKDPIKEVKDGDVVLYIGVDGKPIIHRVIKILNESGKIHFLVMGDNNPGPLIYQKENKMDPKRIIGKVVFRIPYLGLPKVWLTDLINYLTR